MTYRHFSSSQKGFSLVEVIITIVVVAVFAAFLVSFMGTGVIRSSQPFSWLRQNNSLTDVAERITLAYRVAMEADQTLDSFKNDLDGSFGSEVDSLVAEYTDFEVQDDENYQENGADSRYLKVVLVRGDQKLTILFTE